MIPKNSNLKSRIRPSLVVVLGANPDTTPLKSRTHKPQPLKEFTLFPKLPIELRIKIWKLAVRPRLVGSNSVGIEHLEVIHACKEARYEILKNHMLIDTLRAYSTSGVQVRRRFTYFDIGRDVYYAENWYLWRYQTKQIIDEIESVERVAINLNATAHMNSAFWVYPIKLWSGIWESVLLHPKLKELCVVMEPYPVKTVLLDGFEEVGAESELTGFQREMMAFLINSLELVQQKGRLKDLAMKFVRMEKV